VNAIPFMRSIQLDLTTKPLQVSRASSASEEIPRVVDNGNKNGTYPSFSLFRTHHQFSTGQAKGRALVLNIKL
jgi:hypothetical protein